MLNAQSTMSDETQEETQEEETQETEEQKESTEEQETEETSEEESQEEDDSKDEDKVEISKEEYGRLKRDAKRAQNKEQKKDINSSNSASDDRIERLELKQDGYSDEIVNEIMELGGKQALKNNVVKTAVNNLVEQEKSEKAADVDGSSQSSTKTNVSRDELRNMSAKEMEKHLPKA